jgi:hypothetical protein
MLAAINIASDVNFMRKNEIKDIRSYLFEIKLDSKRN